MEREYAPIGFIYLGGLICASFMGIFLSLAFAFALLAACVALFLLKKKRELLYVGILCAAVLAFVLYSLLFIEPVRCLSGATALVTGTVTECGRADNDTVRLVISGESNGVPIKLVLYASDFGASAGDRVSFTAFFSDFSDSADFEEAQYYFSKGIFIKARAVNTPVITEAGGLKFFTLPGAFSSYLRERIRSVLGGDEGELLCAMFFGDKSGLSSELSVCLKRAGLSHMTAVSGMHLSLIVNTAAAFIRLLPKNRVLTRFFLIAGIIVLLALFFGMSASVLRSGGMLLLYYAAEPLRRKSSPAHTLGFAAMAITVFEPYACRDMGLWLSILGTFGSAVAAPELEGLSNRFVKGKRFKRLKSSLITSVCAAVCTLPAGALCFGGVSLISAASALVVYPMFFAALIFLLGVAVTGGLFAEAFLLPAGLAAKGMIFITRTLGQLSFSFVRLDDGIYPALVALASAGAVVVLLFTCRLRYAARFLIPVVCVMLTAASVQSAAGQGSTVISVYSDGSDALVVIESDSCVSAISMSDSTRIGRQLFEHTVGSRAGLICVMNTEKNNLGEAKLCRPEKLHLPQTENTLYNISGEYTVAAEDGAFTVNVRGVSVAVLPAGSETDADFAVFSGYGGEFHKSGARTAGTEIFCDKRYRDGGSANAYYDKIMITVSAGGKAVFRREGGAA